MGRAWINETVHWPDAGQRVESWAARLEEYPETGWLARGIEAHEQDRLDAGWRFVAGEWIQPRRRRWSVEEAGATVRKAVMRLVVRKPPPHVVGPIVDEVVGALEACADLVFYATTDEAWEKATVGLAELAGKYRRVVDPLRPRFMDAGQVLGRVRGQSCLGAGPQSYAVAESKGRTRARWDEIHCSASHVSSGSVKSLGAVELSLDAQRAVLRSGVDEVDLAGLVDWLRDGLKREERIRLYRRRLALRNGVGVGGFISDTEATEATQHISDRAIAERLTRARAQFERCLSKLPERAEALAEQTGDMSFLAPLAHKREERRRQRPQRPQAGRIPLHAPRAM